MPFLFITNRQGVAEQPNWQFACLHNKNIYEKQRLNPHNSVFVVPIK